MKNIFYVYRTARKKKLAEVRRGLEPDHLFYGLNHLQKLGYQVDFSDIAYSFFNILYWITLPLERFLIYRTSIGFKLDQAILLSSKLRKFDLIISVTDSAGLPILLFKKLKLLNKPIIYVSTGLVNELNKRKKSWIAKFYIQLFQEADAIVCHSPIEKELFIKLTAAKREKIYFIPFGIDEKYFRCSTFKKNTGFIFSVGQDRSRDYLLLSKVAKQLPDERFVVVTYKSNIKGIKFPSNVSFYFSQPYSVVKKFYCQAKLVFLPLREVNRASGQITFLESIASGNKIVVGNAQGLSQVYPDLMKSDGVFLYKVVDRDDALQSVKKGLRQKINRQSFPSKYTSKIYAQNIAKLIKRFI